MSDVQKPDEDLSNEANFYDEWNGSDDSEDSDDLASGLSFEELQRSSRRDVRKQVKRFRQLP